MKGLPEHCDKRAEKFFGFSFGDRYWDSGHPELASTRVLQGGQPVCAYCGKSAYPIQAGLAVPRFDRDGEDYSVTGYTCVCSAAMDEVAHRALVNQMLERHEEELEELSNSAPKPSQEVFEKFICRLTDRLKEKAKRGPDHLQTDEVVEAFRRFGVYP